MAEENQAQEHKPLFSDFEVMFIGICLVVLDIADYFQAGIPGSDIIRWFIQAYQWKKGTNGLLQIGIGAAEAPPGGDLGPWGSVGFGALVIGDRYPDSKLAKLIKAAKSVEKLGAGGEVGE